VLAKFLTEHRAEVESMLYTEFSIDIAKEVWQEEAREEGKIEGKAEEQRMVVLNMIASGFDNATIAKLVGCSLDEVCQLRS
jgi:predicted transposase/invertase (TIGR01784 family)